MQGEYPTDEVVRPRLCGHSQQVDATARFYFCAGCRAQVLICSCCDRGNIYCGDGCASAARRSAQQAAGRRYQSSRRGRRNHAERARRYRERQKKVTHQGSPASRIDDVISSSAAVAPRVVLRVPRAFPQHSSSWRCRLCGRPCSPFLRTGFLRRRRGADP
jgi:hypothetical protein